MCPNRFVPIAQLQGSLGSNQPNPGPCHRQTMRIRRNAVRPGKVMARFQPTRCYPSDQFGESRRPVRHHGAAGFKVKLHPVSGAKDTETLGWCCRSPGQMDRAGWQGERVGMPLEYREIRRDLPQHRIILGRLQPLDAVPAKFQRAADLIARPQSPRQQLRAETYPQNGLSSRTGVAHQRREAWQIGVALIGQRVLLTAKHHHGIMGTQRRQKAIPPRPEHLDPRRCLVQGNADLSVMGDFGIFYDRYMHGVLWPIAPNIASFGVSSPPNPRILPLANPRLW
jgi:hypothetical protein